MNKENQYHTLHNSDWAEHIETKKTKNKVGNIIWTAVTDYVGGTCVHWTAWNHQATRWGFAVILKSFGAWVNGFMYTHSVNSIYCFFSANFLVKTIGFVTTASCEANLFRMHYFFFWLFVRFTRLTLAITSLQFRGRMFLVNVKQSPWLPYHFGKFNCKSSSNYENFK